MKKIVKWLNENGFEFEVVKLGNPYYFNDDFSVDGILVSFYFDEIGNDLEKRMELEKYMKNKKSYNLSCSRFGSGHTYKILSVFDSVRLERHENLIKESCEKFWIQEHEKRMQEKKAI